MLDLISAVPISGYEQNFSDFAPGLEFGLFIDEDHEIDGFGDQMLLRRARGLSNEAFETNQTAHRVIGMNSCSAAGVAGIPRLEKRVCFGSADFADHDSGRFQPHAGPKAIEHRHMTRRRSNRDSS